MGVSPRVRLIVGMISIALGFALVRQVFLVDPRFFPFSAAGIQGLFYYVVGDYSAATAAYRAHWRGVAHLEEDPVWGALLGGDLETAKRLAEEHLRVNPGAPGALLTLGEIALEEKAPRQALTFVDRVLERQTDQFDALLLASIAFARLRDYGQAIDALNRTLRHDRIEYRITSFLWALQTTGDLARLPRPERPLCLLAHYHRYLRIFNPSHGDIAIRYAEQAIAVGDRPADAYLTQGIVYIKQRKRELAFRAFRAAVERNPRNPEALRWAAKSNSEHGDLVTEYRLIKAAYEAAPTDPYYSDALFHVVADKLGDWQQALTLMQDALQRFPRRTETFISLGYIYSSLGEYVKALEHYQRAAQLDPRSSVAQEGIGYALKELGRLDEAVAAYRIAIALAPYRPGPYYGLANIYYAQRRLREAIAAYERAIELGGDDLQHLKALCGLYLSTDAFWRAANCYKTALARDPGDQSTRHLLAVAVNNLRLPRERP